jgi:hypothetical protein
VQDQVRAPRRRKDEICVLELDGDGVEGSSRPADALGELLRALQRAAGDDHFGASGPQVAGGELAHLPRAEQERAPLRQAAECFRRELDGGRGDRLRQLRQFRLGADPFARVQRVLEEPVQERAGRPRGQRSVVCLPHLAEDLRLARDERVEPGGDAEQVLDRIVFLPSPEYPVEREPRTSFELLCRPRPGAVGQVDLGPVAGRQHHHLGSVGRQRGGELERVAVGEVEPLPNLERRVPVRDPDCEQGRLRREVTGH